MYNIEKIEQPLLDKIINSALKEFSTHGYERASYNNILKEAGISKGRFYQYVKSKRELYDYLVESGIEKQFELFQIEEMIKERDIVKRYHHMLDNSVAFYLQYPCYFSFFKSILNDKAYTNDIIKKYGQISHDFKYNNVDISLFKDPNDIDKKVRMMKYTANGIIDRYLILQGVDATSIEMGIGELKTMIDDYFKLFREMFYR